MITPYCLESSMKSIVIYSTHRNNTEKVALAIAQVTSCKSVKLTKNFDCSTTPLDDYDLVFLGTGIRGGEPYVELLNFVKELALGNNKRFILFMTWAGGGASDKLAYERVKKELEAKGHCLDKDYFICLGQTFGFTRRGRPNETDLTKAKNWATEKLK
jgi:flavodoxin